MDGFVRPIAHGPRQALPRYYRINGAVYVISVEQLKARGELLYNEHCYAYVMPRQRSIDIDDAVDFLIAQTLLQESTVSVP